MLSTMFMLSQARRRPERDSRGMVRNSSPPMIPLNRRKVLVFCLLTASSTSSGRTTPTSRFWSSTTGTPNKWCSSKKARSSRTEALSDTLRGDVSITFPSRVSRAGNSRS